MDDGRVRPDLARGKGSSSRDEGRDTQDGVEHNMLIANLKREMKEAAEISPWQKAPKAGRYAGEVKRKKVTKVIKNGFI